MMMSCTQTYIIISVSVSLTDDIDYFSIQTFWVFLGTFSLMFLMFLNQFIVIFNYVDIFIIRSILHHPVPSSHVMSLNLLGLFEDFSTKISIVF